MVCDELAGPSPKSHGVEGPAYKNNGNRFRSFCRYRTQREQAHDRACSKADKLRDRLQWEPGILNGNGWKPKGMHWRTFERLQKLHDELVNQSLAGVIAKFGALSP